MRFLALFLFALITACTPVTQAHPVIEAHAQAFNAGDIDAMSSYQHPDIEWFNVSEATLFIEVKGRDALTDMMREYIASSPGTVGSLRDWSINGDFVAVTETAHWTDSEGNAKDQSALTVYQLEDDLIRRVWYYPAKRD
ncbi:MAG: nuclear transport factor 2 family protein [Pseudomonadota bacterium]